MSHKTATGVYSKEQRAHRDAEVAAKRQAAQTSMDVQNAPAAGQTPGGGNTNPPVAQPEIHVERRSAVDRQVDANVAGYATTREHEAAQRELTGKKNRP